MQASAPRALQTYFESHPENMDEAALVAHAPAENDVATVETDAATGAAAEASPKAGGRKDAKQLKILAVAFEKDSSIPQGERLADLCQKTGCEGKDVKVYFQRKRSGSAKPAGGVTKKRKGGAKASPGGKKKPKATPKPKAAAKKKPSADALRAAVEAIEAIHGPPKLVAAYPAGWGADGAGGATAAEVAQMREDIAALWAEIAKLKAAGAGAQ